MPRTSHSPRPIVTVALMRAAAACYVDPAGCVYQHLIPPPELRGFVEQIVAERREKRDRSQRRPLLSRMPRLPLAPTFDETIRRVPIEFAVTIVVVAVAVAVSR